MSKTLLAFIWKYSARQQIILLALTILSFPILYMSLELPKQIINEAIGSTAFPIELFGLQLGQFEYLGALCIGFLLTVILSGILKMRTNIFKGIVAERLLRRFRYQLVTSILRFPLPYFRRNSQGALISMVTAEAEPLGAMMGDAVSRPVFALGQMLTITAFLFIQSVWLGLAAIIVIPFQAYIIPKLQRRINKLNKQRILVVRSFSDRIGETVTGVEVLRTSNGLGFALADFSRRLGKIFNIRLEIYNLKFFMKFLNNFMNQLTPFLFLSIGGYLVIKGELTVGSLAAALASHKDLMSPWRGLLAYYSQIQDVSLRYVTITEQFTPDDMIDEKLFYGHPETREDLAGPISIRNISLLDQFGMPVLNNISAEIKQGEFVAIQCDNGFAIRAFVHALNRSILLSSGSITIAGKDIATLHQETLSNNIGTAGGAAHIFGGSVADNIQMALMPSPLPANEISDQAIADIEEATRVGNSSDPIGSDWLHLDLAGVKSQSELRAWWLEIIHAAGLDDMLLQRGLEAKINPDSDPELAAKILQLRGQLSDRINTNGASKFIHFFDRSKFSPGLTISENILFAVRVDESSETRIAADPAFLSTMQELGLADDIRQLAIELMTLLVQTFAGVGASHPMFQRATDLSHDFFEDLVAIYQKLQKTDWQDLSDDERHLVITLPFKINAEQFEDAFPQDLIDKILKVRRDFSYQIYHKARDYYYPLDENAYCAGLTIFENLIFGRLSKRATGVPPVLLRTLGGALENAQIRGDITLLNTGAESESDAGINGVNLPQAAHEHIDFIRAVIRRPDILILNRVFSTQDEIKRSEIKRNARALLPDATIIVFEPKFRNPQQYDRHFELRDGKLTDTGVAITAQPVAETVDEEAASAATGLADKLHVLSRTALFAGLDRKQLRLLAYGSHWVQYQKDDYIFRYGDQTDGAYTFTRGTAELWLPRTDEHEARLVSTIEPGRIIGDLSVIMEQDREFELRASSDIVGLRIGKQAFLDIIEHDNEVALSLLRTVSSHLLHAHDMWS